MMPYGILTADRCQTGGNANGKRIITRATLLGEVDVVIVGAGPVRLTMANLLSLKDSGSRPDRKWQR